MKERKNAEQAYADALKKMTMPAQLDTEKQIISSGTSKIRMKSRLLAYAAAAAVLAVCIGVGVMIFGVKDSDYTDTSAASEEELEKDQTIPDGYILTVQQAVEEHRKCQLLENDEYIKLKQHKGSITAEMAASYKDRIQRISARDKYCISYIAGHSEQSQPLFIHAVKYDDGQIDISFHMSTKIREEYEKLPKDDLSYHICDAKTGEKLLKCVTNYSPRYNGGVTDDSDGFGVKLELSDLKKLSGELSFIAEDKEDSEKKLTIIDSFSFTEKMFINAEERSELAKQASFAEKKQQIDQQASSPISVQALDISASEHGVSFRISICPKSEKDRELFDKLRKVDENGNTGFVITGADDNASGVSIYDANGTLFSLEQVNRIVKNDKDSLIYDCYLQINKPSVPKGLSFDVYVKTTSSSMTSSDIENGIWKGDTLGKVTLTYDPALAERQFVGPYGKTIFLSDIYFTIPDNTADKTFTIKFTDGTEKKIGFSDLSYDGVYNGIKDKPFGTSTPVTVLDRDVRVIFFKEKLDTSKVSSIVFAGSEYKQLTDDALSMLMKKYKNTDEAKKAFEQAYNSRLELLETFGKDLSKHTADKQKYCEEIENKIIYDYQETMDNAAMYLANSQGSGECIYVSTTTANELEFEMWLDWELVGVSVSDKAVISTDKEAENVAAVCKVPNSFCGFQGDPGRRCGITVEVTDDISRIKPGQKYYLTLYDTKYETNGKRAVKSFTLSSDKPHMSGAEQEKLVIELHKGTIVEDGSE